MNRDYIVMALSRILVILSLFVGPHQLNLNFSRPLIVAMFLSVMPGAMISGDGHSNWYKGVSW